MVTPHSLPPIIPPDPSGIPEQMRKMRRWAPWRAQWNPRAAGGAGKYEKIPHRAARPEHGLSNKNASGWVTFDEAMAAYRAHPDRFAGVGYLMTGPHGVTGVDLDHCRDPVTGKIDEWALEIAAKLDSYTEVSPSGTGLHVMVSSDVAADWMNHERGIEVYGGNAARFLCVTGHRVPGSPVQLRAPRAGILDDIATRYRKAEKARADVEDLHLPDLLPVELLPDLADLDLPPHARNFLADGAALGRDRSNQLFATSIALAQAGLARDEVLSILEANEHAMEIALDHRRQDYDKALRYLWKEHCRAGSTRAAELKQLQLSDFDDVGEQAGAVEAQVTDSKGDFDDLGPGEGTEVAAPKYDLAPVKLPRFTPITPGAFLKRKPAGWIVKGILPRAGLAVIYGASGSGKTFFTLDMVGAVAQGLPWRGAASTGGRAVYVVAEGAGGFRNRLEAYCGFHGVEPDHFDVGVVADAPNLLLKDDIKDLLKALVAFGKVDLIVIDTYARAMAGGNENDAKDVGQAVAHCDLIHRKTGALVVLVHHSGKDASNGARGSSALRAAADVEIEVVATREYRAAKVTKQKDGQDGQEFRFKLQEAQIGEDEDGDAITSCVVEHLDATESPSGMPHGLRGNLALVFDTLRTLADLDADLMYAQAVEACVNQLPQDPTKRDRRRDVVVSTLQRLADKGIIRTEGGKVYL